jgi:hypothetical protein
MEQPIVYVGLNLHMDTIAAAFAQAYKRGELRSIANPTWAPKRHDICRHAGLAAPTMCLVVRPGISCPTFLQKDR